MAIIIIITIALQERGENASTKSRAACGYEITSTIALQNKSNRNKTALQRREESVREGRPGTGWGQSRWDPEA